MSNGEEYVIKCNTKKAVGYIHLKNLYSLVENDLQLLIERYPEIVDGLWKSVQDTNNETKRREIVSLNVKIMRNDQESDYLEKEKNMIVQLTKELQERKQQIIDSLEDIEIIENDSKVKKGNGYGV